ncbi:MAG: hypothetical protein ABW139_17955 [Candidatus Thiodiazotropha sp. DIVDIV]
MNKSSYITLVVAFFTITGCGNDDSRSNDTEQSPLLGVWLTESCEPVPQNETNVTTRWAKSYYEFTSFDTIRIKLELFSDSDCTLNYPTHETEEPIENPIPITYLDTGELLLQEGVSGGGMTINFGVAEQQVSVDAFYTINQGRLCFSDAFTFEVLKFGISEIGQAEIDFENCLTRP